MPLAANIVINDGAATPVAHTFTPLGKDAKGTFWFEQTTPAPTNPLGAKRIGVSLIRPASGSRLTGDAKAVISIYEPVLEVLGNSSTGITPPPTLAYQLVGRDALTLAQRSTKQERKDLRVLKQNLLGNAQIVSMIDDLLPIY